MERKFNVVFTGQLKPGSTLDDVIPAFASRLNLSEEKASSMLRNDKTVILKQEADQETASKFQEILAEIGMIVEIFPSGIKVDQLSLKPNEEEYVDNFYQEVPKAGKVVKSDSTQDEQNHSESHEKSFNPYQKAELKRPVIEEDIDVEEVGGEEVVKNQRVFKGAVSVPASRGISWITEGYGNHVQKNLGAWIGAMLLYVLASIVLGLIPFVGSIGLMVIGPVIIAGFMIGARDQSKGKSFTVKHLLSGFNDSLGQLMLVAVLYLVVTIILLLLVIAIFGVSILSMADSQAGTTPDLMSLMLAMLVFLLFMLPLLMSYWFAPALVALEGLSALEAMKQSFIGCMKNMLPMLIYGVLAGVLVFVAMIPFMLGLILLMPVLVASIYVGYTDIFRSSVTILPP